MKATISELRYALRVLYKRPAFAVPSLLTLALAIAANTAIFSVINAVLLHPLPFKTPNRLVMLWEGDPKRGIDHFPVSVPYFEGWQHRNQVFERMAALAGTDFDLVGPRGPERVSATLVSANFFDVLGTEPLLGRTFIPEEDRPDRSNVAVISYELWQRRFGNIASPVGQPLNTDTATYTIIGVLPPHFRFLEPSDVWVPLGKNAESLHIPGNFPARILAAITPLKVVARLKAGVSLRGAESDITAITRTMQQDLGSPWQSRIVNLADEVTSPKTRRILLVLQAAVGLVFLLACINVANLMLAYITSRQKETAARIALGATRRRLILQLMSEGSVIAISSGILGLLLGYGIMRYLTLFVPAGILGTHRIEMDGGVLLFTLAISILAVPLFGTVPALRIMRPKDNNVGETLREGVFNISAGSRNRRLQGAFVASEVAIAMILLIGTLLTVKSLYHLSEVDLGLEPSNVLTIGISLSKSRYKEPEKQYTFFKEVINQTSTLPGVQDAGMVNFLPLMGLNWQWSVSIDGSSDTNRTYPTNFRSVGGDYFRSMQIPLVQGRVFVPADEGFGANVAIINEAMAKQFWPNQNPLGHRVKMGNQSASVPWLTIVGVVGNVKEVDLTDQPKPVFYVPLHQSIPASMTLVLRTATKPSSIIPAVLARIHAIDPDQPVHDIRTMKEVLSTSLDPSRFTMLILSTFAGIATVLALVGIYGALVYSINQRRREIGIRLALGARRGQITAMIVRHASFLVLAGVTAGLLIAAGLTRFLAALLYEVQPFDASVFVSVPLLLTAVAMLASYWSALRAYRIDPSTSLRYE